MDKMDELDEMISANEPAPEQVHQPYFETSQPQPTASRIKLPFKGVRRSVKLLIAVVILMITVILLNIFIPKPKVVSVKDLTADKAAIALLINKQCQDGAKNYGLTSGVKGFIVSDEMKTRSIPDNNLIIKFKQIASAGVATISCANGLAPLDVYYDDLFLKINNTWKIAGTKITITGSGFLCSQLASNNVPKDFINTCSDKEGSISHAR
ncbi:MAG: hypothetical protein WCJ86_03865 [Candidatus Saccharibacteria bacterium]